MQQYQTIANTFKKSLFPLGFDLVYAFPIQRYNAVVPPTYHLPTFGRNPDPSTSASSSTTLGILVANTKHLWPIFLRYLYTSARGWDSDSEPLDDYVRSAVDRVARQVLHTATLFEVRYSDLAEKQVVAFQRLAHEIAGMYFNEKCYLNVHERFGAWVALRAVEYSLITYSTTLHNFPSPHTSVVIDHDGPPNDDALFPTPLNPYPSVDSLLEQQMVLLRAALPAFSGSAKVGISHNWRAWVEMRDLASGFLGEAGEGPRGGA
ncbi:hypothetical protein BC937DRAFT_90777 [Endogone sp. FLAS-F59071]|nr:hypothetical protein BC937DRAFT_90777 [Endogone sp. FLAS-F59071]|eukprot:RUS23193.1 hypothetical protein BC937DRAFT_90777 [Endogone sp. FLAS-F59071]